MCYNVTVGTVLTIHYLVSHSLDTFSCFFHAATVHNNCKFICATTSQVHACKLTLEIVELVDREADLMLQGMKKSASQVYSSPTIMISLGL